MEGVWILCDTLETVGGYRGSQRDIIPRPAQRRATAVHHIIWNTVIKCAVIWDGAKDKTKYEEVQNDEKMIAYCGLDRGKCDAYLATVRDDQALRKKPQKRGQS